MVASAAASVSFDAASADASTPSPNAGASAGSGSLSLLALGGVVVADGVVVLTVSALSCDGADEPLGASTPKFARRLLMRRASHPLARASDTSGHPPP